MHAMILAAGRGERMRPLTDKCPKPLLDVNGMPLIVHQLHRLAAAGYQDVIINLAYRGAMIRAALGSGRSLGLRLHYSQEGDAALETGGGIRHALPLLGNAPFLVINADIWCDHPLKPRILGEDLAHLVLVDNPSHHPQGDFHLHHDRILGTGEPKLTFSGIGYYRPELFSDMPDGGAYPLAPILRNAINTGRISGEHYHGNWTDVGTPQRLAELNRVLQSHN